MRLDDNTFFYYYPFKRLCSICNNFLQGRLVASKCNTLYCQQCALKKEFIDNTHIQKALDKIIGHEKTLDFLILQSYT